MNNEIILTTTNNLEGFTILEYKDVISEEVCFANKYITRIKNMVNDFVDNLSSLFEDTELSGTTMAILKAKEYVKGKLINKARELGANAIIGIDFETSYGVNTTLIRVSINGTAVVAKRPEVIQKENEEKLRLEEEIKVKELENIEKQKKILEDKDKFKNSNEFIYETHEENIKFLKNAKEIYNYIVDLNVQDEYFKNVVVPEIYKIVEIEKFYGNNREGAINKLKTLTAK